MGHSISLNRRVDRLLINGAGRRYAPTTCGTVRLDLSLTSTVGNRNENDEYCVQSGGEPIHFMRFFSGIHGKIRTRVSFEAWKPKHQANPNSESAFVPVCIYPTGDE